VFEQVTKPESVSTSSQLAWMPLVNENAIAAARNAGLPPTRPARRPAACPAGSRRCAHLIEPDAFGPGPLSTTTLLLMSKLSGLACRIEPATASTFCRSALPACQAASPPMPAARDAQVPPP